MKPLQINIYRDQLLDARLFGTPVLYSTQPILREDVPQGWYCYDLRGTIRRPDEPHALVDKAEGNHVGSILSCQPLKSGRSQFRLVKNQFQLTGQQRSLSDFCAAEHIRCPQTPIRHQLRPASPEEAGLFYAQTPERDEELGAIGHVRIYFGHNGGEGFRHTWRPRGPGELNTQEFREELDVVLNDLRKGVLRNLSSMRRYCSGSGGAIEGGTCCQNYGFTLETERYLYRLRCNPTEGDYQAYLNCFDKQAQQMGLTEKGRQVLKGAADPTLPHSYDWYVIEHINNADLRTDHHLPLEEAIALYASLDCEDKRLGVTKDGIAAVDLMIRWEGREWLSEDRLKLEGFKNDPVVADAVVQLQRLSDARLLVGRITFVGGEIWEYVDTQKYLEAIQAELPYYATTGFRCETLTDDPKVRKAADDMLYNLYGEKNPKSLADYGNIDMVLGGME